MPKKNNSYAMRSSFIIRRSDRHELEQLWKQAQQAFEKIDSANVQTRVDFLVVFQALNAKIEHIIRAQQTSPDEMSISADEYGEICSELAELCPPINIADETIAEAASRLIIGLVDHAKPFATSLPLFINEAFLLPEAKKIAAYFPKVDDDADAHSDLEAIQLFEFEQYANDLKKEQQQANARLKDTSEATITDNDRLNSALAVINKRSQTVELLNKHPNKYKIIKIWLEIRQLLLHLDKDSPAQQQQLMIKLYQLNQLVLTIGATDEIGNVFQLLGEVFGKAKLDLEQSKTLRAINNVVTNFSYDLAEPSLREQIQKTYDANAASLMFSLTNINIALIEGTIISDQNGFVSEGNSLADGMLERYYTFMGEQEAVDLEPQNTEQQEIEKHKLIDNLFKAYKRDSVNELRNKIETLKRDLSRVPEKLSKPEQQFKHRITTILDAISVNKTVAKKQFLTLQDWVEDCQSEVKGLGILNNQPSKQLVLLAKQGTEFPTKKQPQSFYQRHKVAIWGIGLLLGVIGIVGIASGGLVLLGAAKVGAIIGIGAAITALAIAKPVAIASAVIAIGAAAVALATAVALAVGKAIDLVGRGISLLFGKAKNHAGIMPVAQAPIVPMTQGPITQRLSGVIPAFALVNQFKILPMNNIQEKVRLEVELNLVLRDSKLNDSEKYIQVLSRLIDNIVALPQVFKEKIARELKVDLHHETDINAIQAKLREGLATHPSKATVNPSIPSIGLNKS